MNISVVNSSNNLPSNDSAGWDCSLPVAHGITLIFINAMVCVSGTLGNIMVCVAVVTNPRLRRRSNYFLFSLAIADLIVTMISEPLFVAILLKKTFFNSCAASLNRPFLVLIRLSCTASVLHLAAISVDRLFAVVFPLRHKFIMGSCVSNTMLIACWTVSFLAPVFHRLVPNILAKVLFGSSILFFSYLVVFFCYSLIVISLARKRKMRHQLSPGLSQSEKNSRVEARVAVTLAIVILVFTASWIPFFVIFWSTGKPMVNIYGPAFMWIRTLALSNSAMNFVIYGSRMKNFRESFSKVVFWKSGVLTRTFSGTVSYTVNSSSE